MLVAQNGGKVPIFDFFDIPYTGMRLDQPYHPAIDVIGALRLYTTHPDMGHPEQMRLIFPELKLQGEIFASPAIRPGNDCPAAKWESDCDINVLCARNLALEALERFWGNRANGFLAQIVQIRGLQRRRQCCVRSPTVLFTFGMHHI